MTPERYRASVHDAARQADWQRIERISHAYGWSLLGQVLLRGLGWLAGRSRPAARRRRPFGR